MKPGPCAIAVLGTYTGRKVVPVHSDVLHQTMPKAEAAHPLGENSLCVPQPSFHLFSHCLQNEDVVVTCTSNKLLKHNTLGKFSLVVLNYSV